MIIKYGKVIQRDIWKVQSKIDSLRKKVRELNEKIVGSEDINVVCPLCGAVETVYFAAIYSYIWRACNTCKSAYVANPPPDFMLEQLYSEEGEYAYDLVHNYASQSEAGLVFRAMDLMEPKVEFIIDCIDKTGGTWLDVGCGIGEISYVLKQKGWTTTSVDPNRKLAEIAKNVFNVNVQFGMMDFDLPRRLGKKYDVVSMFNLMEHIPDPIMSLKVARKLVNVGGYLVIEVPHFPNLTAYLAAMFPEMTNRVITAPVHLFMFSMQIMSHLLQVHGFENEAVWFFGNDFYCMLDMLDGMGDKGVILSTLFSNLIDPIQKMLDENLTTEQMLIVSRRIG